MTLIPRPIQDQVLVRQDPPAERIGLIYMPPSFEDWSNVVTVVAVGPGLANATGRDYMDSGLVPGARVVIKRRASTALIPDLRDAPYSPQEFKDLIMLRQDDVMLILDDGGVDIVNDGGVVVPTAGLSR